MAFSFSRPERTPAILFDHGHDHTHGGPPDRHAPQERTGGRAYYNTNNVRGALRRVLEDSRLNYVLGYYPQSANWHGEYRKIKVEVHQPGVHLQYRRRYVALPEERTATDNGDKAMYAAAVSPLCPPPMTIQS